jgi:hypothetical protein
MSDPIMNERAEIAAAVIEQFAAPTGGADTPEFAAFLAEFPTVVSRGNLKVILWKLAEYLRTPPGERTSDPTRTD